MRAVALSLYLVPALAINGAVFHLGAFGNPALRRWAEGTMIASAIYASVVLGLTLFMSLVSVNDFATVVGAPRLGFVASVVGAAGLSISGVWEWRSNGAPLSKS